MIPAANAAGTNFLSSVASVINSQYDAASDLIHLRHIAPEAEETGQKDDERFLITFASFRASVTISKEEYK